MKTSIFLLCLFVYAGVSAQGVPDETPPYYIDLNTAGEATVRVLRGDVLAFQYHDAIGKAPSLAVNVSDWRGSVVSRLVLQKTFGLNHYSVPLTTLHNAEGATYRCETQIESGRKLSFYFRKESATPQPLAVGITSDAVELKCDEPAHGVLDFLGSAAQARLPFTATWFVLNSDQTDLLFLPLEQRVDIGGTIPSLTVDHAPAYYVVLFITDACGNQGKQMVHVVCEDGRKRYNTILLEKLPEPVREHLPRRQ